MSIEKLSSITAIMISVGVIVYQASTVKIKVEQVSSDNKLLKKQVEKINLFNIESEKTRVISLERIAKNTSNIEGIKSSIKAVNELVSNSDIIQNTNDLRSVMESVDKLEVMVNNSSVETRDLLLKYLKRER